MILVCFRQHEPPSMLHAGSGTLAEELLAAPDSLSRIKSLPPANEVELLEIGSRSHTDWKPTAQRTRQDHADWLTRSQQSKHFTRLCTLANYSKSLGMCTWEPSYHGNWLRELCRRTQLPNQLTKEQCCCQRHRCTHCLAKCICCTAKG